MAKRTTQGVFDDYGRFLGLHTITKAQANSEARAIPWTPGPKNAWQRFARKAVG